MLPVALLALSLVSTAPSSSTQLDAKAAQRFAQLALDCVHKEYPNKIGHVMLKDGDAKPPRKLTPAFYGCFDWHSSVHGHWLLVRLLRKFPDSPLASKAAAALARSFTAKNIKAEVAYMAIKDRRTFERPYGLAWLLQLAGELREWHDARAMKWAKALAPLETLAADRFEEWFVKLSHPIRTGEHSQTAFAMGLIYDWAVSTKNEPMLRLISERARDYYGKDIGCLLAYEPGGQDFLSPCLAEADLMRRILPAAEYAAWLAGFLPDAEPDGRDDWLVPAVVSDKTDGKLAHLDGLNISRAWMLEGIVSGLAASDARFVRLRDAAREHREAGLHAVNAEHYEGGHWLGSFAMYLVTGRGIR